MMIDRTHHHTRCLQSMRQSRETIVETSFRHSSIVSLYYASAQQGNSPIDQMSQWMGTITEVSFDMQFKFQSYAFIFIYFLKEGV